MVGDCGNCCVVGYKFSAIGRIIPTKNKTPQAECLGGFVLSRIYVDTVTLACFTVFKVAWPVTVFAVKEFAILTKA
jgi:hypothetical protein